MICRHRAAMAIRPPNAKMLREHNGNARPDGHTMPGSHRNAFVSFSSLSM